VKAYRIFAWNTVAYPIRPLPCATHSRRKSPNNSSSRRYRSFGLPAFTQAKLKREDIDGFFDSLNANLRYSQR